MRTTQADHEPAKYIVKYNLLRSVSFFVDSCIISVFVPKESFRKANYNNCTCQVDAFDINFHRCEGCSPYGDDAIPYLLEVCDSCISYLVA